MAFSKISKPGTKFGPCKLLRKCGHKDCREMWAMAYETCPLCGLQIGFEKNFCKRPEGVEGPGAYVHLVCAMNWAERRPTHET